MRLKSADLFQSYQEGTDTQMKYRTEFKLTSFHQDIFLSY